MKVVPHTPLALIILDGFGYREGGDDNAIAHANTPNFDKWWQQYPHALISGSGKAVGLPAQQMGNSEVGHLNIGAGRIVQQDFTRIDSALESGEFADNAVFNRAFDSVIKQQAALHVCGLVSPGGVHSHERQLQALINLAYQRGVKRVYLHAFLDGRDTPPQSAQASLAAMTQCLAQGEGRIASLCGRYYAMDRDQRWDRIASCYQMLTQGVAPFTADSAVAGLAHAYERGETDEFVQATMIIPEGEKAVTIADDDAVVFMNYRADRARQLSYAFCQSDFAGFERDVQPKLSHFVTLTEYASDLAAEVAFPPLRHKNVLGEHLAQQQLPQLRIAETEKYAHVTFFFNGGVEPPFAGEKRLLIPSPKVATYDLQPQMSAEALTDQFIAAIEQDYYASVICNFANADMVGHTGNLAATITAIETIDQCLGRIVTALQAIGGEVIITADHGNAEKMYDKQTAQAHTAHTSEPVPCLYIGRDAEFVVEDGALSDIAPTMLYLMGLPIPEEMTGRPLLTLTE